MSRKAKGVSTPSLTEVCKRHNISEHVFWARKNKTNRVILRAHREYMYILKYEHNLRIETIASLFRKSRTAVSRDITIHVMENGLDNPIVTNRMINNRIDQIIKRLEGLRKRMLIPTGGGR